MHILIYQSEVNNKIIKRMSKNESQNSRSYHSQDKRRSVSREQHRKYKMQKMKLKFKSITKKIKEIKNQNSSDLNQLTRLIENSDQIQKIAHQSLQRAKVMLSESKMERKKMLSPPYQNNLIQNSEDGSRADYISMGDSKGFGKISVDASYVKDDKDRNPVTPRYRKTQQTNSSQNHQNDHIDDKMSKISEASKNQSISQMKQSVLIEEKIESITENKKIQESKDEQTIEILPRASIMTTSSKYASTRMSMKNSGIIKKNEKRRVQSIYPYIAVIIFSIIILLFLSQ